MKENKLLQWLSPLSTACVLCKGIISSKERGLKYEKTSYKAQCRSLTLLCRSCVRCISWIEEVLCDGCGRGQRCPDCLKRKLHALWMNRSSVSYNSVMKEWLHLYKFQGNEALSNLLGDMLVPVVERLTYRLLKEHMEGYYVQWKRSRKSPLAWMRASGMQCWDAIVPVPIGEERLRERGFNQAEQLALVISERFHIPCINLLERTEQGQRQSHQGREARIEGATHNFRSNDVAWNQWLRRIGKKSKLYILLIDDVYTTGSTIHACANILMNSSPLPCVIVSATWARS